MRKQRRKESLQGDNARSWLAGATASLGGAYNDIVHMGRGATANQQDTNSRSRTSPTTQAANTLGFRSMQVIFWLHRLKVVVAQPPGRRVRQSGHKNDTADRSRSSARPGRQSGVCRPTAPVKV